MIPIAKPCLDEREAEAVRRVILSGRIIRYEVAAFTRDLAARLSSAVVWTLENLRQVTTIEKSGGLDNLVSIRIAPYA